ncbi:hypothetical protein B0I35DRAFT_224970 [Stachybotrys elegans]|uniref:Uncharacterized protein n=1 Tax=Stachybotrys elegans TaxID=80388 RepID=A0A8K0WRH8_9HYPO|nr:hypothetical protein B0I35DRAFT_224970 [Stachybotrys elegans]
MALQLSFFMIRWLQKCPLHDSRRPLVPSRLSPTRWLHCFVASGIAVLNSATVCLVLFFFPKLVCVFTWATQYLPWHRETSNIAPHVLFVFTTRFPHGMALHGTTWHCMNNSLFLVRVEYMLWSCVDGLQLSVQFVAIVTVILPLVSHSLAFNFCTIISGPLHIVERQPTRTRYEKTTMADHKKDITKIKIKTKTKKQNKHSLLLPPHWDCL